MIISVKHQPTSRFDSDEYLIDLDRKFEGYENGDLICGLTPFYPMPLRLEIAISRNGNLKFRAWKWVNGCNNYLHTYQKPNEFTATPEQIDTINGLFSGRIKFEGLELAIGKTVLDLARLDIEAEEQKCGHKIYLA